jgi:CheY-like chemotaxis protein
LGGKDAGLRNRVGLAGVRILVVEDNFLLAMEIEALLRRQGCEVVGPAGSIEQAVAVLERAEVLNAAVLDVDLQGRLVTPVAAVLRARGVPYVLVTGYARPQLGDPELEEAPRLDKPVSDHDLLRVLRVMLTRPQLRGCRSSPAPERG